MFVMAGADFLILIAWIVVAVSVGKPVSYLNCYFPGRSKKGEILENLVANLNVPGSMLSLENWSGLSKSNCLETKAIWGFSVALCILFATSSVLLPALHLRNKKVGGYVKQVV